MLNAQDIPYTQKHKSIYDPVKEELSLIIRDTLHNLDLNDKANTKKYDKHKLEYIALFEGKKNKAYYDVAIEGKTLYADQLDANGEKPKGNITVGYGFNMDSLSAKGEWKEVFKGELSFDDVYRGRAKMTEDQMTRLLQHSVEIREDELRRSYGHVWDKLRANEKIAVLSAYYNGRNLVSTKTRFFGHLKKYVENNDPNSLKDAAKEHASNRKDPRLIERRELEAKALDATVIPTYLKPNDKATSDQPLKVIHGVTRVPLGLEQSFPQVQSSAFVIWRTKLDSKVRVEHLEREGKVYHVNEIAELKEDYGCRCVCEPVTTNLLIVDDRDKIISLHSWIRYGGASSFEA